MPSTVALIALASEINAEHEAAGRAISHGLQHAKKCGELLLRAKSLLAHGQFGPWLEANFKATDRTAQGYMRIAKRWPDLQANFPVLLEAGIRPSIQGAFAVLRSRNDVETRKPDPVSAYLAQLPKAPALTDADVDSAAVVLDRADLRQLREHRDLIDRLILSAVENLIDGAPLTKRSA